MDVKDLISGCDAKDSKFVYPAIKYKVDQADNT